MSPPPPGHAARRCQLAIGLALFIAQCDEPGIESEPNVKTSAVTEDADAIDVQSPGEQQESESASTLVLVKWNGLDLQNINYLDEFSMTLESQVSVPVSARVTLQCSGIGDREGSVELGTHSIDPRGSIVLGLAANEIPIQPFVGAGTMIVQVSATVESDGETSTERLAGSPIHYRHVDDGTRVSVFTHEILKSELAGIIDGRAEGDIQEGELVGRIMNTGNTPNSEEKSFMEIRHTKETRKEAPSDNVAHVVIERMGVGLHSQEDIALEEETVRALEMEQLP